MDDDLARDTRKGKAKVEEDDSSLVHEPMLKTYRNLGNNVVYLKTVGPWREDEVVQSDSPESIKKIQFRFRAKEYLRILGKEDKVITRIHYLSRATISILCDYHAKCHKHLFLELVGSADDVKKAEILIVYAITEVYPMPYVPKALMPTKIAYHAIKIFENQVVPLFGIDGANLLKMESEFSTWIEVEKCEGKILLRIVTIYGERLNIRNTIIRINDRLGEESVKLKNEVVVQEIGSGETTVKMEDENKKDVKKDDDGMKEGE